MSSAESIAYVSFPRVALTTPFFTLERHLEGWKVALEEDGEQVTYEVGVDAGPGLLTGSLTVDDAEVLVGLLEFADLQDGPLVRFGSLNALGTRIWGVNGYGGQGMLRLVTRLGRLSATGIVRRLTGSPLAPVFRILSDWDMAQWSPNGDWHRWDNADKVDGSYRASQVLFSSGFMRWMQTALDVDAKTFLGIRSRMGRALYLYLPSKAYPPNRYSANRPRTLELAELLQQLGAKVPAQRAARLQLFERPDREYSIARELDKTRLWCGCFRFAIEQRPAPADHRVKFWIEQTPGIEIGHQSLLALNSPRPLVAGSGRQQSRLMKEWMDAGGSAERWMQMKSRELADHAIDEEINGLIEDRVFDEEMAQNNRDAITLGLKVIGLEGMQRVRSIVGARMREAAVNTAAAVRNAPKFWMGCLKDEIRMLARSQAKQNEGAKKG